MMVLKSPCAISRRIVGHQYPDGRDQGIQMITADEVQAPLGIRKNISLHHDAQMDPHDNRSGTQFLTVAKSSPAYSW